MAPLSKLTLTKFERSQTHQEPVLERRAKALNALAQQRDIFKRCAERVGGKLLSPPMFISALRRYSR